MKRKSQASTRSSKKGKLFELEPESNPVRSLSRSDHFEMVDVSSIGIADPLEASISFPTPATCPSSSSTLVARSSKAPTDSEVKEILYY